jgi:hypothetical protein
MTWSPFMDDGVTLRNPAWLRIEPSLGGLDNKFTVEIISNIPGQIHSILFRGTIVECSKYVVKLHEKSLNTAA